MYAHFLSMKDHSIDKWVHYFPIYERYLRKYVNESIVVFEIGVQGGGSGQLLKKYLGPHAVIVGIDIDESCKRHEDEQVKIRIGDQSDLSFLKKIVLEFGAPDIVIDDGSHVMRDMAASFDFLYPLLRDNGVYIVEDTHTCYWKDFGGGLGSPDSFMEKSKALIDKLHFYHCNANDAEADDFVKSTYAISFFDSVIVFEKKKHPRPMRKAIMEGKEFVSLARPRP